MPNSCAETIEPISGNPLAALKDQRLLRFFAYLEGKRGDREFAARRDIDPLDFAYILGNVVLIDVLHEPLHFRYRLVGSIVTETAGYDLTGSFIDEHPNLEYRAYTTARYRETVIGRRPTGGNYNVVFGERLRGYQCLRVPLSDDGETIDMIVAAFILGAPTAPAV